MDALYPQNSIGVIIILPQRIFFTGAPGSRWGGVSNLLTDTVPGFNISDRAPERTHMFKPGLDHVGAFFGRGMEFSNSLEPSNIDQAHADLSGCRLIKSHEWAYKLDEIKQQYPDDWIILVYRPDLLSFAWWHSAGGFDISYPNYAPYKDAITMMNEIAQMNQAMLYFARTQDVAWNHLTSRWMKENFGVDCEVNHWFSDMLVAIIK